MADLIVQTPLGYSAERKYILKVLLGDFLGLSWRLHQKDIPRTQIQTTAASGEIILPDTFFQTPDSHWRTRRSLPPTPLTYFDLKQDPLQANLIDDRLPILFGRQISNSEIRTNQILLPIDIFGAAFFMLSRYEELITTDRDSHGRFPATASLALQNNFLDRPIVDEYVEILKSALKLLWPHLPIKPHQFRVLLSHDIDRVRRFDTLFQRLLILAADLIKRRSYKQFINTLSNFWKMDSNHRSDPFIQGIYQLAEMAEQHDLACAFYFMAAQKTAFDRGYDIRSDLVQRCIADLRSKGHEIGFHPSYRTVDQPEIFRNEKERLDAALGRKSDGGRQHYLRFKVPDSWRAWEQCGLQYDSSLGFADHEGFRCGTCHPFQPFDIKAKRLLKITEIPLIVMDGTLKQYRRLSPEAGKKRILTLANYCRQMKGIFTLLWHNSSLHNDWEPWARVYREVLIELSEM